MLSVVMLAPLTLGQDTFSTKGPGMYHVFSSENILSTDIWQTLISLTNTFLSFWWLLNGLAVYFVLYVSTKRLSAKCFFDEMARSETMMARSFVIVHLVVSSLGLSFVIFKSSSEAILSST